MVIFILVKLSEMQMVGRLKLNCGTNSIEKWYVKILDFHVNSLKETEQ